MQNFGASTPYYEKFLIGSEEWCSLPSLGLPIIKIRIDSGAKTSALHAVNIIPYIENGVEYVKFDIHPIQDNRRIVKSCVAPVVSKKVVRSSNDVLEHRFVISTKIKMGDSIWDIDVSLTNRDSMGYRMILGREGMRNRVFVDPDSSFLTHKISDKKALQLYSSKVVSRSGLNIILLASNPELYSNKRIMEAARARNHNISFVNIGDCYINVQYGGYSIYHAVTKKELKEVDAVIPRLRPSMTFYGCALTRQFNSLGAFCLNDAVSISNSRDKLRCLQILAGKGINLPVTSFASAPDATQHLIETVGGAPVIIKLLEGTQGRGVVLAETRKAAASVINAFKSVKANILVQEYIKEAGGSDIRCFVIEDKVVAAMQRRSAPDDFRSNLHLGGRAYKVQLTKEEVKIAISASRTLGLKVAGVDIIRSKDGPKVIEVNSSPGLEGVETITGKDIATMMIRCIEKNIYGISSM